MGSWFSSAKKSFENGRNRLVKQSMNYLEQKYPPMPNNKLSGNASKNKKSEKNLANTVRNASSKNESSKNALSENALSRNASSKNASLEKSNTKELIEINTSQKKPLEQNGSGKKLKSKIK